MPRGPLALNPDDLRETFALHLMSTARSYRQTVDRLLKPYGVPGSGILPLRHLALAENGIRQHVLAKTLNVKGSTLAVVLDRLWHLGFIQREEDPADRRFKLLRLTEEGKYFTSEVQQAIASLWAELFAGVAAEDVAIALSVIRRAIRSA